MRTNFAFVSSDIVLLLKLSDKAPSSSVIIYGRKAASFQVPRAPRTRLVEPQSRHLRLNLNKLTWFSRPVSKRNCRFILKMRKYLKFHNMTSLRVVLHEDLAYEIEVHHKSGTPPSWQASFRS